MLALQHCPSLTLKQQPIPVIQVDHPKVSAQISLFGGHLISFKPAKDQRERLYLSPESKLDGSKAIRGGVPVCWPWFSDHADKQAGFPAHGYVRQQQWLLVDAKEDDQGCSLRLRPNNCEGAGFSGHAALYLDIHLGDSAKLTLVTTNNGSKPFRFTAALHSYFAVEDIAHTRLQGLDSDYLDKTQGFARLACPTPYTFNDETDRIHLAPTPLVSIVEDDSSIDIRSEGHDSIVVWNPWAENATAMGDMPDDGYQQMLCVETAITQSGGHLLEPGEQHPLVQQID